MYPTYNERKSVTAERFIRTWKNKIYEYMTSISKKFYIDKLENIIDEYNDTYRKIKIVSVAVKPRTYIDFDLENNHKILINLVGDHARISNYKNIFAKGYTTDWFEEVFVIKKLKIIVIEERNRRT